jgi:signal transduction histidine kinase
MGICKDEVLQPEITELRRNAEILLKAKSPDAYLFRKGEDNQRLIQELEIHRIELEMQNSELRLARQELESALERFTDLYEFAPVGYVTLDSTGIIKSLNLAGASLIGGVRSRLIGSNFRQFVAATHRLSFSDFLGKVLTCQVKESCEIALLNNGIIVQIEAMATASGQEFRLALIDITEKRHSEDVLAVKQRELEDLNSCLVERIAEAVCEQRRMDQIAIVQDRRAAMGEMIGNIAHQWRQPLNVLGLNLQDLPLAYGKAEFTKEYLTASVRQSMQLIMHMSHTIDDFRNFFIIDKEKVNFSVNQVIRKTLALVEESFKEQMVFTVFNSASDPKVVGYPNEYAQVLLNVLINSRDALVGNSIDDARIVIQSFTEAGKSIVTITDNAGGITREIIDRVFDPYFTTKGPDKGTGIGLFMSKTIIEKNMGGSLTVHNAERGAEFRIEL